jgi:AcrR family transcriptional regulator
MPAGRPRSESARRAILGATREELAAGGYDKLSIDRVALAAGVAKQTVYRWYPSKSALVADSLLQGFVETPVIEPHNTGDVRRDVADWVRDFVAITLDPEAIALIRASAAAAAEDREVARGFQGQVKTLARNALAARLRDSEEAGQLRQGTPVNAVAEILVGSLLYRLFTHEEITIGFVDELVSILFDGIAEAGTSPIRAT